MKKSGMIAACVAAVLVLWVAVVIYGNPFKVTDPSDPRFNPDKFSFRDYKLPADTRAAFRVLFPPGTPKEFVDSVLIKAGGGRIGSIRPALEEDPKYILISYSEPNLFLITIKQPVFLNVVYDENYKVINIYSGGYVFKNKPSWEELNQMKEGVTEKQNER